MTLPVELTARIHSVYGARNGRELAERYDLWAPHYDYELESLMGYVAPQRGAETLARYVAKSARILDAGAGTGLVGQALRELGYRNLVAVDNSEGMLSRARDKGIYQALYRKDMAQPLDFPAAWFGAVVSVGVFTYGHAQAACLEELIRVTNPGGFVVFSLRPDFYESSGFAQTLASLETRGKWELVEVGAEFRCFCNNGFDDMLKFWVYRVK
jgi:predicted TPR repeat methyltransferase